jgi:hypothetical protein
MRFRIGSIQNTQDRDGNVGVGFNLMDESGGLITLFLYKNQQAAADAKELIEQAISKAVSIRSA